MRFIRKNGRIIPIREKGEKQPKPGGSIHLQQAKDGAIGIAASGLAVNAAKHGHGKTAIALGVAGGLHGIGSMIRNVKNSVDHGKQKKSGWHGLGRFITNNYANSAGALIGAAAIGSAGKLYKTARLAKKLKGF